LVSSISNALNAINSNNIGKLTGVGTNTAADGTSKTGETSFSDYLSDALNKVNDYQVQSQEANEKLATGEISDIHSVMIAGEKAELTLQLTLAIRNKIMDAYSEIMRMQV
jgi:flagellar hook-basal body complex protein FliE